MIIEYNRPTTIDAALTLLARSEPQTLPLAGGTVVNRPSASPIAVVDLQALGLDTAQPQGNFLDIGATVTLQDLWESKGLPGALQEAILHEATHNLRQVATVAGTILAADGRSPFATALLALDASLNILTKAENEQGHTAQSISLGDLLPVRKEQLKGRLVTYVTIPLNAHLMYEFVARTPADKTIVCAAVAHWPSGRTRVALGGFGSAPVLAFDGADSEGVGPAARSAYSQAGDEWASAEYRQEMAGVLAERALEKVRVQADEKQS